MRPAIGRITLGVADLAASSAVYARPGGHVWQLAVVELFQPDADGGRTLPSRAQSGLP